MLIVTVVVVGSRSCLPLDRTSPLLRDSWVYLSLITYLSYLLSSRGDSMGILRMTGEGGSGVPVKRVRRAQQGFTLLVKLLVWELMDCKDVVVGVFNSESNHLKITFHNI